MMSLNGPVPWMCKSRLFHSLFPSTSSFIFTAAKHSSGGFVNGNTTYVCLSVLFLLGWPIVRQGLDDCIFVVIWTWFVGFPFSFGQWIQNKWVVSGGKGFRVSRTFRWAGPLFRYGSLSLPLTWRAAQDEDDGDDDCGAFWNNSSQMPRLFMPLSLPRSPFTFHPSLIRPFFFLFFSAVSTRNGQDEERINNKEASCLLSHALVYIQPFQ